MIGAVVTQGGVVGAGTIVVLIGNDMAPLSRDRRCTLRFYSDGKNGT